MAILKRFSCKGSMGVYYGLGLEEISINFESISGLVTFAGENGLGKTTIMELLSPFDCIKSRQIIEGNKYNLKNEFMLRDSYKEVVYQFNDKEYVFRVEVPAGTKSASPEGYITCDGVPLVKGKITEYRKKVKELFGSEELFYSSIFSCQGGEKLTDKTVGEFKQLLIELLGLNKYTVWWHNAGKVIKVVTEKLDAVLFELNLHNGTLSEINSNKDLLKDKIVTIELKKELAKGFEQDIDSMKNNINVLLAKKTEAEKNEALAKEKLKQIDGLVEDLDTSRIAGHKASDSMVELLEKKNKEIRPYVDIVEKEEAITGAADKIKEIKEEQKEWILQISEIDDSIETEQKELNSSVEACASIKDETNKLLIDPSLKSLTLKVEGIKEEFREAHAAEELEKAKLKTAKDDKGLKTLELNLSHHEEACKLLSNRPDDCIIDDCPFIENAVTADGLRGETKEAIAYWKKTNKILVDSVVESLFKKTTDVSEVVDKGHKAKEEWQQRFDEIEKNIKELREKLSLTETVKANISLYINEDLKPKKEIYKKLLDRAPIRIADLQSLADQKSDLKTAKEMLNAHDKSLEENKKSFLNELKEFSDTQMKIISKIETIKKEIAENTPPEDSDYLTFKIDKDQKSILALRDDLSNTNEKIINLGIEIAVIEDKTKISEEDQKKINSLNAREKLIRKELSKWEYVRAAVSKSGLQALEIASAAPLLTGIANDLLHSAFGGEFFLDLVTEDDEGKEVLDIMITREDGKTFPLSKYSGGEKVYILQAFKAAQIYVNSEKSGIHFSTAFCDEESSALDKDKAEKFILMYRALMVKSGFEKLIYITHIPECQALADHVLTFEKGGIVSESDIGIVG
jgi:DNA repair exonuclease SbcCD ATPase subunit